MHACICICGVNACVHVRMSITAAQPRHSVDPIFRVSAMSNSWFRIAAAARALSSFALAMAFATAVELDMTPGMKQTGHRC